MTETNRKGPLKGHGSQYGRKKEVAIAALLSQRNVEEAARSIGVGHSTLLRWMRQSDFDGSYREARRAAFSQCVARLQQASGAAVSTLLKIMLDTTAPHASRVRAAECILERASRAIELEDVEARVRQLEANVLQEKP